MRDTLTRWAAVSLPNMAIPEMIQWINKRHWKQLRKEVATAIIGAIVYHTWQARNWRIFRQISLNLEFCVWQIKKEMVDRIGMFVESKRAKQCPPMIQRFCN